jgi:acetyl esterase/lipase
MLNVTYGNGPLRTMDVYLPANRSSTTNVIVFVHGGSFIAGDKNDFTTLAKELVKKDFAVANINYQLVDAIGLYDVPAKHQKSLVLVQDQVNDVSAVVDYAIANAGEWNVSESKIALAGHSAGATLALLYAYGNRNTNKVKVVANLAGALDQTFTDITNYNNLLPGYILELGYRYTGFEANTTNEPYYKAISPLYVANAGQKNPTLTVFPELNGVGGLPKQDRNTFDVFTTKLNSLNVPNKFVQITGADHEFSKITDVLTVINEMTTYFKANLK